MLAADKRPPAGPAEPQLGEMHHQPVNGDDGLPHGRVDFGIGEEVDCWTEIILPDRPAKIADDAVTDANGVRYVLWLVEGEAHVYPLVGTHTRLTMELAEADNTVTVSVALYGEDPNPTIKPLAVGSVTPSDVLASTLEGR